MDGILAAAFLVGCMHNLLICEDLRSPVDWFGDIEACRTALPALIRHHERREGKAPVILGKCQLMIRPKSLTLPPDPNVIMRSSW